VSFRFHATILASVLAAAALRADWRDEIGFTRLQLLAAADLPSASGRGLTQTEALESPGNYAPDDENPLFAGKTFTLKSGSSGISSHATHAAANFYGTASLLAGNSTVDLYSADNWIGTAFLKKSTPDLPLVESRAVQNHSWIGDPDISDSVATEINQRLDFAINRDGFVCVVGENNGNSTVLPTLLGQGYHTISVGRDDGKHSAGFTAMDTAGRIKPDIVAPSAAPEYATSWTTPMVAGAAGLLHAGLSAAPYSLASADLPRVVKALLLASATKNTVPNWSNTATRPLDLRYGAGELNVHHAYLALRAGRAAASNSTAHGIRGWAAESVSGNSTKTWFFTIPAGASATPFSAALTWHRVVSSQSVGISKPRVWSTRLDDLNLRLHQAAGFTVGGQIAASQSAVDNVELVYQPALAPGTYALVVENTSPSATTIGLAWHSLPVVSVAAGVPDAREIDGQAGTVALTRTGDTTLPMRVPLIIGGTAVSGTHYQALPSAVTIPAGQSSITLPVAPVSDSIAQGNRTVTVTVAADFALVRDPAQSAVVTIQDKPFDSWRFANFTSAQLADPAASGDNADPDADTLANLIEYALGLPPTVPSIPPSGAPPVDFLTISAVKNPAATDIVWGAQVTGTLDAWEPAVIVTDSPAAFEARDSVPMGGAGPRFIRLKISRP
jgi:hypothetical protein